MTFSARVSTSASPHRRKHNGSSKTRNQAPRAPQKVLKRTKGFFLTKIKLYQSAQEAVNRAERFSYRDRRDRKRQFRTLWIQRIGAAARERAFPTAN